MSASASKKKRKEMDAEGLSFREIEAKKEADKRKKNTKRILIAVGAVLLTAAIIFGVIALINAPYHQTAAKIADQKISVPVYNCFYNYTVTSMNSQYAQYGMNLIQPNIALSKQKSLDGNGTMEDYMIRMTNQTMESAYNLYIKAAADPGFQLSEAARDSIKQSLKNLEQTATNLGYPNLKTYLEQNFGKGTSEDDYETFMTVLAFSSEYNQHLLNTYEPSADEMESKYQEHAGDYDYVIYYASKTSAEGTKDSEGNATYTDEEKAKAKSEAEAKKDAMPEDAEYSYKQKNAVTQQSKELADWLFDDARKEGDTEVFALGEDGASYITVRYEGHDDNNYQRVNAYVLTIPKDKEEDKDQKDTEKDENTATISDTSESTEKTDDEKDSEKTADESDKKDTTAKKETAQVKLEKVKAGLKDNMTDEEFESLISACGLSTSKNSPTKATYSKDITAWLYDDARKAGDMTTELETEDAYYVIRWVDKQEKTYRQELAWNVLYDEMMDALVSANKLTVDQDALRYAHTDLTFYSSTALS